ncbi:hypothetical protein M0805_001108 [Coniferiporia weirii]|nr:hypothetical protein M0805_001108 [Coniferiporia weirii]
MQFFKFAALLAFPILAAATPGGSPPVTTTVTVPAAPTSTPASECNTGDLQCCQSTTTSTSTEGAALLALIGVVLTDPTVLLGTGCSPISVIGLGSGACTAAPVCCDNNSFNGLVAIGCVPVTL